MVDRRIRALPLTARAFAPYGDVIAPGGGEARIINAGQCTRWHDQARPELASGAVSISVFEAEPRALPYTLDLIERHPEGTQAFLPMTAAPFLVVVAGAPEDTPCAFLTLPHQGVQFLAGTWHGVLTPLHAPGPHPANGPNPAAGPNPANGTQSATGLFWVVDRAGDGNLEEHRYDRPWTITGG